MINVWNQNGLQRRQSRTLTQNRGGSAFQKNEKIMFNFSDFTGVNSKSDVILRIADAFKLHDITGANWDAFMDFFTNLNPDSEVVRTAVPIPTQVHLAIKSISSVKSLPDGVYETLMGILNDSTLSAFRGDNITFTRAGARGASIVMCSTWSVPQAPAVALRSQQNKELVSKECSVAKFTPMMRLNVA